MIQRIKLILLLVVLCCAGSVYGQVTIGSDKLPAKAAILDIKDQDADGSNVTATRGGLGLPRVELVSLTTLEPFIATTDTEWTTNQAATMSAHAGLMVYNLEENSDLGKGVYVWNGSRWGQVGAGERYFYIPSFNIPLPAPSETELTFNLYNEYVRQFTDNTSNPTFVSSNSSLTKVPSKASGTLYEYDELDYVVTYYDSDILKDVSVTTDGELKYKVKSQATSVNSFLNVVFVVK